LRTEEARKILGKKKAGRLADAILGVEDPNIRREQEMIARMSEKEREE
jgi:hypothetical protein